MTRRILAPVAALLSLLLVPAASAQCDIPQRASYNRGNYGGWPYATLAENKAIFVYRDYPTFGIAAFDITDPGEPRLQGLGSLPEANRTMNFPTYDSVRQTLWTHTYTDDVPRSFFITSFDLSDDNRVTRHGPFEVNESEFGLGSGPFIVHDGRMYMRDDEGIRVFDVSDLSAPPAGGVLHSFGLSMTPIRVSPNGRYLYVAASGGALITLDLANFPTITIRSSVALDGWITGAYLGDDFWLLPSDEDGFFAFHIYDFANPAVPEEAGSWTSPESDEWARTGGFLVRGTVAQVSYELGYTRIQKGKPNDVTSLEAAKIFDLSDLSNPAVISDGPYTYAPENHGAYGLGAENGGGRLYHLDQNNNTVSDGWIRIAGDLSRFAPAGDRAYVVDPGRLVVMTFDRTNPDHITLIAESPLDEAAFEDTAPGYGEVFAVGRYLYFATPNYDYDADDLLVIFDMTDPYHPRPVDRVPIEDATSFRRTAMGGDLVAAVYGDWRNGVCQLLDLSDPEAPAVVSIIQSTHGTIRDGAFADGSLVVLNEGGIERFDVSDPANPVPVAFVPNSYYRGSIAVTDERIFAYSGVAVFSVDRAFTSGSPIVHGVNLQSNTSNTLGVWNDMLAVLSTNGVDYFDATDPSDLRLIDHTGVSGINSIDLYNGTAWVGGSGLRTFDLQNGTTLSRLGSAPGADSAFGVTAHGNLALLSDYTSGLRIFDASDPYNPVLLSSYPTADRTYQSVVTTHGAQTLACLADGAAGLTILDITDPAAPTPVGSLVTSDLALALDIEDGFAFVATRFDGLQVIDISDPAAPTLVGSVDTPGSAQGVTADAHIVYVADGSAGVQVIDTSNRANPTIIGSYDTPQSAREVFVRASTAFIPDRATGLIALDISDPTDPTLLGTVGGMTDARSVTVHGHLALVADFDGRVHMVDVSDPGDMQRIESVATLGTPRAIAADGRSFYLADGDAGLTVLEARPCWYRPCPADLNDDGVLDFFDLQVFLNAYSGLDGLADWNDNGAIEFFDLQGYLIEFTDGCP